MDSRSTEEIYELLSQHLNGCDGVKVSLDRWVRLGASLRQRWSPQLGEDVVDGGLDELETAFEEYEEALTRAAAEAFCLLADRASGQKESAGGPSR
ncbi:MAG TPA: hypothetical protein VGN26_15565 [Armatimonadota bacterium]|jgi:hypothetical protein